MDGRQDEVVLVAQRYPSLVAGRLWRLQRQLREEPLQARVGRGNAGQLLDVGQAHACILEEALELRLVPAAGLFKRSWPGGPGRRQRLAHRDEFKPRVFDTGRD